MSDKNQSFNLALLKNLVFINLMQAERDLGETGKEGEVLKDSEIPLLGIYSKQLKKRHMRINTHTRVFTVASLIIAQSGSNANIHQLMNG